MGKHSRHQRLTAWEEGTLPGPVFNRRPLLSSCIIRSPAEAQLLWGYLLGLQVLLGLRLQPRAVMTSCAHTYARVHTQVHICTHVRARDHAKLATSTSPGSEVLGVFHSQPSPLERKECSRKLVWWPLTWGFLWMEGLVLVLQQREQRKERGRWAEATQAGHRNGRGSTGPGHSTAALGSQLFHIGV